MTNFELETLLEDAANYVGLSDYGESSFREGLGVMLEMYAGSARFYEQAAEIERKTLLRYLASRLRVEDAFKRHPEIRDESIGRPVFVVGLPRSGTSILFNLLACDPVARPLLHWEAAHPDPHEGLAPGEEDPRLLRMRAQVERYRAANADFSKVHFVDADGPEECVLLQAHTFSFVQMGYQPLVSPYKEWFEARDHRDCYAYYHDLLRMLHWQRPGERWLLKSPAHMWALDVILERFPDACIVQTHRDPLEIIPSYCSMMAMLMQGRQGVSKQEIGEGVLDHLAKLLERGLEARDVAGVDVADSQYVDLLADPVGAVSKIYAHFGLAFSAEAEAGLVAHLAANPKGKHGAHEYALAEYGLSPERVRERLADYQNRFGFAG